MTSKQIGWIKNIQKEHQILFGAPLVIGFFEMNKTRINPVNDNKLLKEWIENNAKNIDFAKRISYLQHLKEYEILQKFAKFVKDNNINKTQASKFINKDRTTLSHHINNL